MNIDIPSAEEAHELTVGVESNFILNIEKGIGHSIKEREHNFGIKIPKNIDTVILKDILASIHSMGYELSIKKLSDGFNFLIVEW